MKVLIASDLFTPQVNGVVTSIVNLQKELEANGHDVRILTLKQSNENEGIEDCVYLIPSFSAGKLYPGVRIMRSLGTKELKDLEDWKPDIIHTQNEFSTFLLASIISSHTKAPVIHTYHTVYEDYVHYFSASETIGKSIVKRFSQNILNRVDTVIVPTEKVRHLIQSYHVTTPIYTIPTGIDISRFGQPVPSDELQEMKLKHGIHDEDFHLLYLGRLAKEKNVEEIIAYLRELPENVKLIIVGGGPYLEILKDYADEKDLTDRVVFTGMVKPAEVPKYYQLGDAFVSGSTSETQGLTYVEALASGIPAICRRDSVLDEVIYNGRNGWQYDGVQDFVEYVSLLLQDEALRKKMGQESLEIAQRYSTKAFYQGVIKAYEDTIGRPKTSRSSLPARLRQKLVDNFDLEGDIIQFFGLNREGRPRRHKDSTSSEEAFDAFEDEFDDSVSADQSDFKVEGRDSNLD